MSQGFCVSCSSPDFGALHRGWDYFLIYSSETFIRSKMELLRVNVGNQSKSSIIDFLRARPCWNLVWIKRRNMHTRHSRSLEYAPCAMVAQTMSTCHVVPVRGALPLDAINNTPVRYNIQLFICPNSIVKISRYRILGMSVVYLTIGSIIIIGRKHIEVFSIQGQRYCALVCYR